MGRMLRPVVSCVGVSQRYRGALKPFLRCSLYGLRGRLSETWAMSQTELIHSVGLPQPAFSNLQSRATSLNWGCGGGCFSRGGGHSISTKDCEQRGKRDGLLEIGVPL